MLLRALFCWVILFFGPAGAASTLALAEDECEQACPEDSEQGQCAPDCDDCTCCAHTRVIAIPSGQARVGRVATSANIESPSSGEPPPYVEEIFHVPKRLA